MVSSLGKNIDFSPLRSYAFEQITVSNTALPFTVAKYALANTVPAEVAQINCETNDVRYTVDGTTPTASVGILLKVGFSATINGSEDVKAFRVIRATGADGAISVNYLH